MLVTKSKYKTMFEEALIEMGIAYHQIRIAMPRHNGKVGPNTVWRDAVLQAYADVLF